MGCGEVERHLEMAQPTKKKRICNICVTGGFGEAVDLWPFNLLSIFKIIVGKRIKLTRQRPEANVINKF